MNMLLVKYRDNVNIRFYLKGEDYIRWINQGIAPYCDKVRRNIILSQLQADLEIHYPAALALQSINSDKTIKELVSIIDVR